ncbi:hypothetical protein BDV29DRAFT_132706 [Aspergillus leporis]|uniref:Uncharacterized protein n=1 Tax=Aspergillus leporis TaxID=41062 RepID=A0A5N5WZ43_9EURO|nr:hypothetical protein BDV29DRAFT_132706 [Aspergillus leporis]
MKIERAEREGGLLVRGDGVVDLMDVTFGEEQKELEEEMDRTSPGLAMSNASHEGKLLGGATSFTDGYSPRDAVRIFPKAGSILIF